jgi:Uma2 family endonuclease
MQKTTFTAEELLRLSTTGQRYELVKGELFEMAPAGGRHGGVAMRIGALLDIHVRANHLGRVFAAETGFVLRRTPDTVRAPDASFVTENNLPEGELPIGYLELAPDLAVEVASPSDTTRGIEGKVADWLRAGSQLVWVIYPATRSATVYRSMDDAEEISEDGHLHGDDVIPGFACDIRELFS